MGIEISMMHFCCNLSMFWNSCLCKELTGKVSVTPLSVTNMVSFKFNIISTFQNWVTQLPRKTFNFPSIQFIFTKYCKMFEKSQSCIQNIKWLYQHMQISLRKSGFVWRQTFITFLHLWKLSFAITAPL